MSKFIFITGGVVSSLGKGLTAASVGYLLRQRNLSVTLLKMDPYINVDTAHMDPLQHGEIYVTDDGTEGDLDLGHYERFTGQPATKRSNVTTGRIYRDVIARERAGEFGGATVQVVPHITNAIKAWIVGQENARTDVVIVELGGTVGDIEGLPYIEAFRQFRLERGAENVMFIHLTLVPYMRTSAETKTKPTQHSVQKLREYGIQPDMLVCRTTGELPDDARKKLAMFCNVRLGHVIGERDVETSIYEVPLLLHEQGVDAKIDERLGLGSKSPDLGAWNAMVDAIRRPRRSIRVGLVAAHAEEGDLYRSVLEAVAHAAASRRVKVEVARIEADRLAAGLPERTLHGLAGVIVPGGTGARGVEGMVDAIRWTRENNVPFLGIGLGMQCAVVEFARHVVGRADATSTEWHAAPKADDAAALDAILDAAFVATLDDERNPALPSDNNPPARRGVFACRVDPSSRAHAAYRDDGVVMERHRNRCEVVPDKISLLTDHGLRIAGTNPDTRLTEIIELPEHPFFVGTLFHPEFLSRPLMPHPLFGAFVDAALDRADTAPRPAEAP